MHNDPLGRGIVCLPGARVPAPFDHLPRVRVDATAPLDELHAAWLQRRPVVLELGLSKAELKQRQRWEGQVYELTPEFEFERERLHFLTWANNYDFTSGELVWWHDRLAARLGSSLTCDGGPRGDLAGLHRESVDAGVAEPTRAGPRTGLALAPDQAAAVLHGSGPARILAPAGSGKTRVLTERLRHLLVDRGYEKERVTALAYNRRAADEMRQRTADFSPRISTLHALGFGLQRDLRLVEEREVRQILRGLLPASQVLGQDPLAPYLEALAEVRLALRSPAAVERRRQDVPGLTRLFPAYRERLRRHNLLDHDEQIYGALERLLADPELRQRAQKACTHLLVDEFQDLTPAYLLLVRLLSAPAYQVFGVGDDDQVIYGYAGATPEYLVHFERYFPGAATYALEVNYRCPEGVVTGASRLLQRNRERVPKSVRAAGPAGEIKVLKASMLDWAGQCLRQIQSWLQARKPTDLAVLSRVQASLLPVQLHLASCKIPSRGILDASVLQRTGMRTALAYLRLANGRFCAADLGDALRRPNRKLRREIVEEAAACTDLSGLERMMRFLEPWPASQLGDFVTELRQLARKRSTGELLQFLRVHIGLGDAMRELDGDGSQAATASHLDDLLALEQAASLHPERLTFEDWMRELLDHPGEPGVRLSTVHRVKGMEWDCVLVYGAQNGLMPHRLGEDSEEERRIFHVAMTRARHELVVVADADSPSPYLDELQPPGDLSRLKGNERRVYQLYLEGHTLDEIAAVLDKSPSACKTWLQLAQHQMRS